MACLLCMVEVLDSASKNGSALTWQLAVPGVQLTYMGDGLTDALG